MSNPCHHYVRLVAISDSICKRYGHCQRGAKKASPKHQTTCSRLLVVTQSWVGKQKLTQHLEAFKREVVKTKKREPWHEWWSGQTEAWRWSRFRFRVRISAGCASGSRDSAKNGRLHLSNSKPSSGACQSPRSRSTSWLKFNAKIIQCINFGAFSCLFFCHVVGDRFSHNPRDPRRG